MPSNQNSESNPMLESGKKYFGEHYLDILKIHKGDKVDVLDKCTRDLIAETYDGITTNQLRNVFSEIKGITDKNKLKLKRHRLAYVIARQVGRDKVEKAQKLLLLIDDLIKNIQSDDDVEGFQHFLESVVAYHKYYNDVVAKNRRKNNNRR